MEHLISTAIDCLPLAAENTLSNLLMTSLLCATKIKLEHWQGNAEGNSFLCYSKKVKMRISVLDKSELWCLHSDSVKRSPLRASMRQLLTSKMISKALWVRDSACPGICGRKKKSHIALPLSLSPLSPFES